MNVQNRKSAVALALMSATLFGLSTPAAKALLGATQPMVLAGLLYLGAGVGTAIWRRVVRRSFFGALTDEAPLAKGDLPWMAAAIFCGGVAGPIALMLGLARTDAATASLLLTFEGVATAMLAWFAFGEHFDRRIALGMGCLVAGAMVLAWSGTPSFAVLTGPLAIVAACLAWGLDNNLTRKVSLADPLQIAELKGLIAGPINLGLGLAAGASLPGLWPAIAASMVGFLGYGVSLVLFIFALRHLGSARTGAYFSTAPFQGALASILFLSEPVSMQLLLAGLLMAVGVWLHVSENHDHEHAHEEHEHSHAHVHDAHHQHAHAANEPAGEPHTHRHQHTRLTHTHPHTPDMHHTHGH